MPVVECNSFKLKY